MKNLLHKLSNIFLNRLVRPQIRIFHRVWSSYQVCGYTGFTLAIFLAIILVVHQELSLWLLAGMTLTAALTFFGLAMGTKIITGEEQLIYYHHEIAIMAAVALLVWLLRQPVLPYLDVTILGIGLFLVFGRIGCFMVGCCHGRPYRWGMCYRQEHADAGFPHYYVGIRLFPIQAVESLFVFSVVVVGTWLVLTDHPPGEALAWYVVTYGVARFFFEFARGDTGRPDLFGFSEAQWTSLLLMGAGVWAGMAGVFSLHPWHKAATAFLVLVMIAVGLKRVFQGTTLRQLRHPSHIRELAEALAIASTHALESPPVGRPDFASVKIHPVETSIGLRISASRIPSKLTTLHHYTVSFRNHGMNEGIVKPVIALILQILKSSAPPEVIPGTHGVVHLLVRQ